MNDRISALMDGELQGKGADEVIDSLERDGQAAETWRLYHLMSDAIHEQPLLSEGFTRRLGERLAAEPTVIAPGRLPGRTPAQRFAYAAAASIAAVALVGWLALTPPRPAEPPLAKVQPAAAPATTTVSLPAQANDYLLAHQGFSPRVSLQGMAPYVRTVADRADPLAK
jgi:sigma-E factor negative regulatory protein RseA